MHGTSGYQPTHAVWITMSVTNFIEKSVALSVLLIFLSICIIITLNTFEQEFNSLNLNAIFISFINTKKSFTTTIAQLKKYNKQNQLYIQKLFIKSKIKNKTCMVQERFYNKNNLIGLCLWLNKLSFHF